MKTDTSASFHRNKQEANKRLASEVEGEDAAPAEEAETYDGGDQAEHEEAAAEEEAK